MLQHHLQHPCGLLQHVRAPPLHASNSGAVALGPCVRRRRAARGGPAPARFQPSDELQLLLDQARTPPVVQLPTTRAAPQRQPPQPGAPIPAAAQEQRAAGSHLPPQQQQQQQQEALAPALPVTRLRPSRMDFATMLAQLAAWRARHLSAHVPRHCFDAPQLGAWVRHQRKLHSDGALEQWKVERLNDLCFEWVLSDQEAKWHHQYHQLRRYRLLYGSTDVDPARSSHDACDWTSVQRWLAKQSRLLAKQKLSQQQRAMLAQLGVTLALPRRLVARTAALQGLNGPERRRLRKKWKLQDALAAEQRRQQQHAALAAAQEAEQQRRQLARRRRQLQRQAALDAARRAADSSSSGGGGGNGGGGAGVPDGQALHPQGQQQELVSTSAAAQQEVVLPQAPAEQQRPPPQPPPQQQQQQPVSAPKQPRRRAASAVPAEAHVAAGVPGPAAAQQASTARQPARLEGAQEGQAVSAGALGPAADEGPPLAQLQQQQQPALQDEEQHVLLFERNKRPARVKHRSRHEHWLMQSSGGSDSAAL